MKKLNIVVLGIALGIFVIGCNKKEEQPIVEEPPVKEEQIVEEVDVIEEDNHDNEERSLLTGQWIPKDMVNNRPYAIMFNNIQYASPQSGISDASILYEALVEGGITRLMGIYEDVKSDRIGSVRSARHYFVSFADEYDAIYVHYGHTKYADAKIKQLGIDTLSGLSGIGTTVYYRDKSIKAPHNAFASSEGIQKGTNQLGYRTEYKEGFESQHFQFYEEDSELTSGKIAMKIHLPYSNSFTSVCEYNIKDKLYYRQQFQKPHTDQNTKEQLAFKNIIIQYVNEWNIDKNGYQTMDIENSSGTGLYITNGKAIDITWQKNESTKKMHYYDMNNNVLSINPGKTFISIFPNNRMDLLTIGE